MIRDRYRKDGTCRARFIRKHLSNDYYEWCEQSADDPRYDIAQGTAEPEDVPDDIKKKCDEYDGFFYACEWPFT